MDFCRLWHCHKFYHIRYLLTRDQQSYDLFLTNNYIWLILKMTALTKYLARCCWFSMDKTHSLAVLSSMVKWQDSLKYVGHDIDNLHKSYYILYYVSSYIPYSLTTYQITKQRLLIYAYNIQKKSRILINNKSCHSRG